MIEMLHEELHGEPSDESGGAGSVFLGGPDDRAVGMGVRPQTSIEGPSTLAVEDGVSLSQSQSGLMANLTSRWSLLAGFPGEGLHLHDHRVSCGSLRVS